MDSPGHYSEASDGRIYLVLFPSLPSIPSYPVVRPGGASAVVRRGLAVRWVWYQDASGNNVSAGEK